MQNELTNLGDRTKVTPQALPADSRQVPNSAGGFTFSLDAFAQARRFLILGTAGGTFYATERDHTLQAVDCLKQCVTDDPRRLVDLIVAVSDQALAPKNEQALFALALVAGTAAHPADRGYALDALPRVARIGTHLFHFAQYVKQFRGWGRGLRRAVAAWYDAKPVDRLAYDAVKYRQRDGWTHRDLLRLSHPTTTDPLRAALYDFICGREVDARQVPEIVRGHLFANEPNSDLADCVALYNLPWEALPNDRIDSRVLATMVKHDRFPYTALVRNLPRLTREGVFGDTALLTAVCARLTSPDRVSQSRVHPYALLLAHATYTAGRSFRSKGTWVPEAMLADALNDAFYLAFKNVEPTGKRRLIALDVSGSMSYHLIGDSFLAAREASAAMALVTLAADPQTHVIAFSDGQGSHHQPYASRWGGNYPNAVTPLPLSARQRLADVIQSISGLPFGGTDCALPMLYAQDRGLVYDSFEVYTDNETWFGQIHPHEVLRDYRRTVNPQARLVVVGMTATDFTIADPADAGSLDVVGFDASAPKVIADFVSGRI